MNVMYKSTRNSNETATASQAILKGLAPDGGLYVPVIVNKLDKTFDELSEMNYQDVAYHVMKLFFTDFTKEELEECIQHAYDTKFDTDEIAPLAKSNGAYYLELFHGPTIAFKDMALSILPYLMTTAAKKNEIKNEIVILTATSGDTGKAALSGFADVAGTKIIVFYPRDGVSKIQEKQMITQKGDNTYVVAIHGNFDDAQTGVKEIFNNKELEKQMEEQGLQFSSANSINIGRLFPQVAYYVYAYSRLLKNHEIENGEAVNFVVPTGNFGNILAAYYSKQIGVPVNKLICASNDNKVLYDFFQTGTYNKNRDFILTTSPSMDILVSSNLERLIYLVADQDSDKTKAFMESLRKEGEYSIHKDMKDRLKDFVSGYADMDKTSTAIRDLYEMNGYVIDTHTAVASGVYKDYVEQTKDATKSVIASTASPYKFGRAVMSAIDQKYEECDDFELIDELSRISNTKIPNAIEEIRTAPVRHHRVCDATKMQEEVEDILGIKK